MYEAYAVVSCTIAGLIFILGVGTLLRNSANVLNRLFSLFCASIAIWLVSNYAASNSFIDYDTALIANKIVLIAGSLALLTILAFLILLSGLKHKQGQLRILTILAAISWILALTPLMVVDISAHGSTWDINFGPAAFFYFAVLLVNAIAILSLLIRGHFRLEGRQKNQIDSILFSALVVVPIVLVTNAILPFLLNYYQLTQVGSFTAIFIVLGMANGIIRHKMFDIRFVIVRALAYTLSIVSLLVLYSVSVSYLTDVLFDTKLSSVEKYILAAGVVVSGLLYQPLRRFFDNTTNKFFYRDAYDPQEFLAEINKSVVATVDLEKMLTDVTQTIGSFIRSEFVLFSLRQTAYTTRRFIGVGADRLSASETETIVKAISPIHRRVIVTDNLDEADELKAVLQKYNIAVLAKLSTTLDYDIEGIGHLMLGHKKSGNPYSKQDEDTIGIIAGELVIAIENALRFEEIENFASTLQDKVDDATKRLKRANDKLKTLDETKDEFISMASHQLRTPLTSVKGYVSMVLEGDAGPLNDMQKKLLEQSFISSQRMVFLIADLLNLSRLKTGKFVIDSVPTNLSEVIEGEVRQLKETAAGKNMTLVYNQPKTFPTLMLDETKIRQVIMNFVDNAIYYTPAGGKIEISLVEKDKSIEFTVKDNGIGVPQAEQHHLFNKFYRAKNAQKARPDGTGLGLFMAKKVIVAQGGALIFSSQVGKGSTFGFSFLKDKLKVEEPVKELAGAK